MSEEALVPLMPAAEARLVLARHHKDEVEVARRDIELSWCWWPSRWDTFIQCIAETGTELEKALVANMTEAGFEHLADERRIRTSNYLGARIPDYIAKLEEMAMVATKIDIKSGREMPDNAARLTAIRMLVELSSMHRKKTFASSGVSDAMPRNSSESEEIRRLMQGIAKGEVKVVAREVTFDASPSPPGPREEPSEDGEAPRF